MPVNESSPSWPPMLPEILVLDTETTGLEDPGLAEIGWSILEEDLGVVSEFSSLVKADKPMEAGASAINGITGEMLVDAPDIGELPWPGGEVVLVCHHVAFDRPIVEPHLNIVAELCTLRLARRLLPDAPDHKLGTLHAYCGLEPSLAHRAHLDVRMVIGILDYMMEGLAEAGHPMTIWEVIQWMSTPMKFTRMPFGKFRGDPVDRVPYAYLKWLKAQDGLDPDMRLTLRHVA